MGLQGWGQESHPGAADMVSPPGCGRLGSQAVPTGREPSDFELIGAKALRSGPSGPGLNSESRLGSACAGSFIPGQDGAGAGQTNATPTPDPDCLSFAPKR